MRMRSPSSAPPLLRRDGSIDDHRDAQRVVLVEAQAADQLVGQADLPAPPVPVMPSTGVLLRAAASLQRASTSAASALPFSSAVISCASARQAASPWPCSASSVCRRVRRQVVVAAHHHLADHPGQAHALAVLGAVDARHAVVLQLADLGRHDDAAAAAEHLDVLAAALPAAGRPCT